MAVDTRAKRQSTANTVGGSWLTICLPNPDGSIDDGDRAHLAGLYSGIPASPSISLGLYGPFDAFFEDPARLATLTEPERNGIFEDPARGAKHKWG